MPRSYAIGFTAPAGSAADHMHTIYPPIQLDRNVSYEIAVRSFKYCISWYTISAAKGNNKLLYSHDAGINWNLVTIPDGMYDVSGIDSCIKQVMMDNGHYNPGSSDLKTDDVYYVDVTGNANTGKIDISLTNSYQVDLSVVNAASTLYGVLGFADDVVLTTNGVHSGTSTPDVNQGIEEIVFHCSLANGFYMEGKQSDVVLIDVPDKPPYAYVKSRISDPMYLSMQNTGLIDTIHMRATDGLGRPINFNGETVMYELHIKPSD